MNRSAAGIRTSWTAGRRTRHFCWTCAWRWMRPLLGSDSSRQRRNRDSEFTISSHCQRPTPAMTCTDAVHRRVNPAQARADRGTSSPLGAGASAVSHRRPCRGTCIGRAQGQRLACTDLDGRSTAAVGIFRPASCRHRGQPARQRTPSARGQAPSSCTRGPATRPPTRTSCRPFRTPPCPVNARTGGKSRREQTKRVCRECAGKGGGRAAVG